ncbi:MAG: anti-sigma factor [Steroidobacteraceae bacterium]
MKLQNPEVIDALAAEYVIGTLRGPARRRFDRYRAREWHIERRVSAWEDRLMPLAYTLAPVTPSPQVWLAIERRIAAESPPARRLVSRRSPRALAAVVATCAVLAGGFLLWRAGFAPGLEPIATIAAADARPIWQIEIDAAFTRLRVVNIGAAPEEPGRAFELWALPDEGAPVSLGLLPVSGRLERSLDPDQARALRAAPRVAVSLEPAGGSPTGAPTGPVLFVADRRMPG